MEMKKYTKIIRLGHRSTADVLNEGDQIIVQEKLDGANASFRRDGEDLLAFSRNRQLDEHNSLRGFYQWVQETIDIRKIKPDYIYFGEWLVRHKLSYGDNEQLFYLFDIYSVSEQRYLPLESVIKEADLLGIRTVPVFYTGEYRGFDHLSEFVGRSDLGAEGEGIVVKNVDYTDRFGNQLFVKLVSDRFREIQKQKAPKDPKAVPAEALFVRSFLAEARVEKMLHKLVDEEVISEQFGIEDMGIILKELGARLFEDIIEEESDSLPQEYEEREIRKAIGKTLPVQVKAIIPTRGGC